MSLQDAAREVQERADAIKTANAVKLEMMQQEIDRKAKVCGHAQSDEIKADCEQVLAKKQAELDKFQETVTVPDEV